MATAEFHYDEIKGEGVLTFRIPDNEVEKADVGILGAMAIKMNEESNSLSAVALSLLIILEGIERAKGDEKRDASQYN